MPLVRAPVARVSRVVPRLCRPRGLNSRTLRARPPRRARSQRGVSKRPPARTRGHHSHRSPVAHLATTHQKPPATIRGGRELNEQSKVLPCVFTGSVVSDTPQRLWPELNGLLLYREKRDSICVRRRGANRATKEGKASGRSDRHCHLPSTPEGARGACDLQGVPVDELKGTNTNGVVQ